MSHLRWLTEAGMDVDTAAGLLEFRVTTLPFDPAIGLPQRLRTLGHSKNDSGNALSGA